MATTYGIGQYRSQIGSFGYLILKYDSTTAEDSVSAIQYFRNTKTKYQDLVVQLPTESEKSIISKDKTYYVKLKIPQNPSYETILTLKLCSLKSDADNSINIPVDTEIYQTIKRIVIPPTPTKDDNYCPVILYEEPNTKKTKVQLMDYEHDTSLWDENWTDNYGNWNSKVGAIAVIGELYKYANLNDTNLYRYYVGNNNFISVSNLAQYSLIESWKISGANESNSDAFVEYDFVFSPKFDLLNYDYLYLETDRSGSYQDTVQYFMDDEIYKGTYLNKSKTTIQIYEVSDITNSMIPTTSNNKLTHIGISAHPNQIFAINGEEIRVGQSGFYELNDYTVTFLGAVALDNTTDRFTIDYEYKSDDD